MRQLHRTLDFGGAVVVPGQYLEDFRVDAASPGTERLLGADGRAVPDRLQIPSIQTSRDCRSQCSASCWTSGMLSNAWST